MAGILGSMLYGFDSGAANPAISNDLNGLTPVEFAPAMYDSPDHWILRASYGTYRIAASTPWGVSGGALNTFFDDFYNRIYVTPKRVELGTLSTEQVREIEVWNAFLVPKTLSVAEIIDGDGLDVTLPAPGTVPLVWRALRQANIELNVSVAGGATIDAVLVLTFADTYSIAIPITGSRVFLWPLPADWATGVREGLEWLTQVQVALDGGRDTEPMRECPRRDFAIDYVADRKERRIIENAMFNWTGRAWTLPVYGDIELLAAALPMGSGTIPMPGGTAGLDFVAGGRVALWRDVDDYELVEIADAGVNANELVLAGPTQKSWPRGTRIYPTRLARLRSAPQIGRKSDQVVTFSATFDIDEPCDWPAVPPVATYLGIPVLEHRTDEAEDPQASYGRRLEILDNGVGLVGVDDVTGLAWPTQSHAWRLHGRAERAEHRSLLYWLAGRAQALWLPTGTDDLQMVEATDPLSATLTVAWAGITKFLGGAAGRRHVRIELLDGTVFHRRVASSEVLDAARERIALEPSLGQALTPAQVRQISWMALSALASDRAEIDHITDSKGVADCAVTFEGTPAEEPV